MFSVLKSDLPICVQHLVGGLVSMVEMGTLYFNVAATRSWGSWEFVGYVLKPNPAGSGECIALLNSRFAAEKCLLFGQIIRIQRHPEHLVLKFPSSLVLVYPS
jgi:hypothetical protein